MRSTNKDGKHFTLHLLLRQIKSVNKSLVRLDTVMSLSQFAWKSIKVNHKRASRNNMRIKSTAASSNAHFYAGRCDNIASPRFVSFRWLHFSWFVSFVLFAPTIMVATRRCIRRICLSAVCGTCRLIEFHPIKMID